MQLNNPSGGSGIPLSYLDADSTLAANSDSKVATQKALKAYADAITTDVNARIPVTALDTDPTAAAESDAKVMSQKAVVDYVAANAGGGIIGRSIVSNNGLDPIGETTQTGVITFSSNSAGVYNYNLTPQTDTAYLVHVEMQETSSSPAFGWVITSKQTDTLILQLYFDGALADIPSGSAVTVSISR